MSELYVYLMCSRNKDNKEVPNFKTRTKKILEYKENEDQVMKAFTSFAEKGVPGEQVRLYRSVNARNEDKVREEFMIRLLRDKPSMTQLDRTLASVAQQAQCRAESKWMFDFDVNDDKLLGQFRTDLGLLGIHNDCHKTPHGYAVIAEHGFDTRKLMEKWEDYDITLKKDDMLFLARCYTDDYRIKDFVGDFPFNNPYIEGKDDKNE